MAVIHGPSAPVSELSAFIELAKDPKGFEAKLKQLKEAESASGRAAAQAEAEAERARQEQAKAAAAIDEANAIMAGVRKGQADLERERDALAEAKRTFLQVSRLKEDEDAKRRAALEERETAIERREASLRAREGNLAQGEAAVAALREELEAKLNNLRKMVA